VALAVETVAEAAARLVGMIAAAVAAASVVVQQQAPENTMAEAPRLASMTAEAVQPPVEVHPSAEVHPSDHLYL